ncbi:MAG: VWA domain-containing protein [Vicinamibacterales bacterium]
MRFRTLVSVVALAGLGAAGILLAQAPQQQQPPVFRAGANLVRVDVAVFDHRGNPVTDLTKADFQVTEDNVPQTVQTVKLIEATGAAPNDDTWLPIRSRENAAEEASRDDIRVFVIFWDEYHIEQFQPAIRARQALTAFARTAFGPTDLVALMDQLTLTDDIRFSRDRSELADAIHQLKGRQGVYVPPRSAVEEAQMSDSRDVEVVRSQVTASALEATIAYLGSIKEGRKSILLVSETIGRVGPTAMDTDQWLQKAIALANTNNTTIYVLDPRGMEINSRPSFALQSLAENTGGRMFASNFPEASLHDIVKDASAYYLLGYSSSQNPADGKYHRIHVKVDRPGVDVKARAGYIAPSLAEAETARTAGRHGPPAEISKAIETLTDTPDMAVSGDLWAGAAPGPDGAPRVTIAWTPREASTGKAPAFGTVRATGPDGRVYFDGPIAPGGVSFAATPGAFDIFRQTSDTDTTTGERQDIALAVPDFAAASLSMSSPVVYCARTAFEFKALRDNPNPVPFAGRQFNRSDRVLVRFGLFGADAASATVTATLVNGAGAKLASLPVTAAGDRRYQLDLPIGSIAQGEYVIAIEAVHGADRVKALLPIHVAPQ